MPSDQNLPVTDGVSDEYYEEYYNTYFSINSTNSTNSTNSSNYSYRYEEYEYAQLFYDIKPFEFYGLGIVWPALVILTTIANVFVIAFFLLRRNRGKPTNLLFVSIAFSDTMTGLVTLPMAFYIYAAMNKQITPDWCRAIMILRFYVSRVFHTVSIWQTLLLGIQRYMCVCHPFISSRWCNLKRTLIAIAVMYILAMTLHCYHVTDKERQINIDVCSWTIEEECVETCIYMWVSVFFLHLLPCFLLIFLTVRTLIGLAEAKKKVINIAHGSASNRSVRDRQITITVTMVVIVFLIPEFPLGIFKLVLMVSVHANHYIEPTINHAIIMTYEIVLVLSFHANFWIYCFMIHDFRSALMKLFTSSPISRGVTRLRSMSSRSSGSLRSMVSRSTSVGNGRTRTLSGATSLPSTSDGNHLVMTLTPPISNGIVHPFKGLVNGTDSVTEGNDDVFIAD